MAKDVVFFKVGTGQRTRRQICDRIAELDAILDELYSTAMKSVANGNIAEYKLDTGQTVTELKYTTLSSVKTAIQGYEDLRQRYVNKLTPRTVTLMDSKNFRRRR